MNWRALQWAYEQDGLSVTAKAVLITFAMHANAHGYSWPAVDNIASRWGMDRKTVRRQIDVLLVRRLIHHTKKRCGATGQVKVYRLPKTTYESGGKSTCFRNNGSGAKESLKSPISGGKFPPNNDNDRTMNKNHDELITLGNSTPTPQSNSKGEKSFFVDGYQNQSAKNHVKWPEFAAWCRSKGGAPSVEGFWSWLGKQKPQWRNKVRQKFDGEEGYELDGKFYTPHQANQRGLKDPELIEKFRKAVRRDGKIQIIPS
jgi:Helix-turn-helix domain